METLPKPGDRLQGFLLRRTKHVPELQLSALEFQHEKTGAKYLHIARDDQNNAFSIGFKTNPPDATGVPHILEHTTLCGSEKYPVRDPFFKMLPRSLSNFMNAYTSADHTTYPFATTNAQDYKNLLSVYLDATLNPLLKEHDYTQEGWRLAPENVLAEDAASKEITFKGVVYNEMKGQMSDARYLYYSRFYDTLFPAINNSGGDPQKMTDLTYEQLKQFHAVHYHPSNAHIITYGASPLTEHIGLIDAHLNNFSARTVDTDIKLPTDLTGRGVWSVNVPGPVDPMLPQDAQMKTTLAWVTGDTADTVESFAMSLISSLLLDGYGSALYQALVESGLGTDYSPVTGYDSSAKRGMFAIGLNGVQKERLPEVTDTILSTLRTIRKDGFERQKVDGILHQLELGLKHKTATFGMQMIDRLNPAWFNGVDVLDALSWQTTLDEFKARYDRGDYLEGLLEKYLLTEDRLSFTMEPSPEYESGLAADEAKRLASKIANAYEQHGGEDKAKEYLTQRELELVAQQDAPQDLACLPTVHVKDIPRQKDVARPVKSTTAGVGTYLMEAPTNGLTYFRALSITPEMPAHLRPFVPLFCDALLRFGTKDKSVGEIEDLIKLKSGGLSFGYHSVASPRDPSTYEEGIALSGFALDSNVTEMYALLGLLIRDTDFDGPKAQAMIVELIRSAASGAVDRVLESGNSFASRLATAGLRPRGALVEGISGITQVANIAALAASPELEATFATQLLQVFKAIRNILISNRSHMRVALTCGQESTSENTRNLESFLTTTFAESASSLTTTDAPALQLRDWRASDKSDIRTLLPPPTQVSYSALCAKSVPYTSLDSPVLTILAELLTHNHLHREIREKGGAYGASCFSNPLDGVFGMTSYRDPNARNTLRIMEGAGRWAVDKLWTERELEEAKISVFKSVDAPRAVNEEGMTEFTTGITPEMQAERRERFLDVSAEQIRDAAEGYLLGWSGKGRLAVVGQRGEEGGSDLEKLAVAGWLGEPAKAE